MPLALGFDADTAYQTSLATSVRASEEKRLQEKENADKERRRSLGLPEDEYKTHGDKRREKNADPHRKKSASEKIANLLLNGGRSSKAQMKGEEKVGWGSGAVVRERGWNGEGELEGEERGGGGGSGGENGQGVRDQNRGWERDQNRKEEGKGDYVPGGML